MNLFYKSKLKKYNLGMTFSGGGAKCLAQAGLLQYLIEQDVRPDIISAVSGGAIIAALYAAGNEPKKILEILLNIRMFSLKNFSFNRLGLIKSEKISLLLNKYLVNGTFEGLKIPVKITVTNLTQGKIEVFSSGDIINPLAASFAYPGVFTPIKIDDEMYADGGIINNYPCNLICNAAKYNLGMYLTPLKKRDASSFNNSFDIIDRVLQINSNLLMQQNIAKIATIIPIDITKWRAFSTKPEQLKQIFNMGYQATKEYFTGDNLTYLKQIKKCQIKKSKSYFTKYKNLFSDYFPYN